VAAGAGGEAVVAAGAAAVAACPGDAAASARRDCNASINILSRPGPASPSQAFACHRQQRGTGTQPLVVCNGAFK
jgi:hypothetical protein